MKPLTIYGSRSDSAALAAVGFLLALAFAAVVVLPGADPGRIAICTVFALLAGLAGGWGLAEAIRPPALELTLDGFTFTRPFRPARVVRWREVERVEVVRRPFGPSLYYQLAGSDRRQGFLLFTAQPHVLAEAMNRCLAASRPKASTHGGLPVAGRPR